jgi:hypothetical protein
MKKWASELNSLFKGRSSNGQKTHEKMLNFPVHKQDANHNHTKIPPHSSWNAYYQQHKQQQMLVKMEGKRIHHTLLVECKLVQPLWRTVWRLLKKLKIELSYDPAILLLRIYPKECKSGYKDTFTFIFIE